MATAGKSQLGEAKVRSRLTTTDAEPTQEEIKQFGKEKKQSDVAHPWYILMPQGRVAVTRDVSTMIALCFVFTVVPFEVSFVESPDIPDPTNVLWILNRVVDLLFVFDFLVTFFVALPKIQFENEVVDDDQSDHNPFKQSSNFEVRLSRIFLAYLKGWLLIDLGALAPSVFEVYFAIASADGGLSISDDVDMGSGLAIETTSVENSGYAGAAAAMSVTRITKLIKLMRVTRVVKLLRLARLGKTLKMFTDDDSPIKQVSILLLLPSQLPTPC